MNTANALKNCHINLASAAIDALTLGKEIRLSVSNKSTHDTALFRVINQNGKPDYEHPAIPLVLAQAAAKSNHVIHEGNTLKLK
jgi:hypothetical protein